MDNRREFFAKILASSLGAVALLKGRPVFAKKLGLSLDKVPSLAKAGGFAVVKLAGKDLLLIRDSESSVRALSSKCTHQHCDVTYKPEVKKIQCKCHGSSFDLTGKVLGGPATVPLPSYGATLSDGKIILTVD